MRAQAIVILGAGAWGTALANAAARAGREVLLWGRDRAAMAAMAARRENARHLPGIVLEPAVMPVADEAALAAGDVVILAVPTQQLGMAARALSAHVRPGQPVISAAKGIERETGRFVTEILAEALPQAKPAILSGPSFAADVAAGLPTAVTLAATEEGLARALAEALSSARFRLYHSTDVRGVEIGGATKNVLAIAAGIVAGRQLGASAAAALTARGFAELIRFGQHFGARAETLTGLSGLGDLILTCGGPQSRNFAFGQALGEGKPPLSTLAEGAFTAPVLAAMAAQAGLDMPIASAVAAILAGTMTVDAAIAGLLSRPVRGE